MYELGGVMQFEYYTRLLGTQRNARYLYIIAVVKTQRKLTQTTDS